MSTSITFATLHPTPKIKRIQRVAGLRAQKAAILTSPDYRQSLCDKLSNAAKSRKSCPRNSKVTVRKSSSIIKKQKKEMKSVASCSSTSNGTKDAPPQINFYCGGCGELYEESRSEWLRCVQCLEWWEIDCAGMLGKSQAEQDQFHCTDCAE